MAALDKTAQKLSVADNDSVKMVWSSAIFVSLGRTLLRHNLLKYPWSCLLKKLIVNKTKTNVEI